MKKTLQVATVIILPVITLILGWQLGASFEKNSLEDKMQELEFLYSGTTGSGQILADPEEEVDLAILWGVWRLLEKHYIHPNDMNVQDMLHGAVGGLVRAVGDQYTVFMTPKQNTDFRKSLSGSLEGIGAELTLREERLTVVAPLKGSPAARAGLQPEDIIVEVDGETTRGETLHQSVQRIRGQKGTEVELKIQRLGVSELITIRIVRDKITVPSTEYEIKITGSGSVGYIAVNQFGENTNREVMQALQTFSPRDLKGIIIDVRYNGGGYLDRATDLVSMFQSTGKVVTVERRNAEPDVHYVYGRPIAPDIPLAVIINEGSASASEILAGALQDAGRAKVIGKQSFGKGTIQEIFDLPGGSSLRITVARWLTPNGRDLGKEGVEPDIDIDRTREDFDEGRDPQLDAAMEWLLDGEDITAMAVDEEVTVNEDIDAADVLEETLE